jgi:hypothetical protein
MIHQFKYQTPFISFGFGVTQKKVAAGSPVTIWLVTLYNESEYTFNLTGGGGAIDAVSNYEYSLSNLSRGTYTFSLRVTTKDKRTSLESKVLTLTIT